MFWQVAVSIWQPKNFVEGIFARFPDAQGAFQEVKKMQGLAGIEGEVQKAMRDLSYLEVDHRRIFEEIDENDDP